MAIGSFGPELEYCFLSCLLIISVPSSRVEQWGGAISSSAGGSLVRKDTQVFRPDSGSWLLHWSDSHQLLFLKKILFGCAGFLLLCRLSLTL